MTAPAILHLNWLPQPQSWPGIAQKLVHLASRAKATGIPLIVAACTDGTPVGGDVVTIPTACHLCPGLQRGRIFRLTIDRLRPHATIMRWPGALDPTLPFLIEQHGLRLLSEHHADEASELRLTGTRWRHRLRSWSEELATPRLLPRLAGSIAVTGEIRTMLMARNRVRRCSIVANGIAVDEVSPTGFRPFTGDSLELVWSCGRFWPWQGLDRMVRGLGFAACRMPITLHLLGDPPELGPTGNLRVARHGRIVGADADAIFTRAHLAVGTLALHRKGLREACPLKTREYLARGLPYLTAHSDPDVPADAPWARHLPAGDDPVSAEAVIAHVEAVAHLDPAQLREEARRRMDWAAKAAQMHAFACQVAT